MINRSADPKTATIEAAWDGRHLGLQRFHRRRKVFGDMVLHVARHTSGPLLLLSRRG